MCNLEVRCIVSVDEDRDRRGPGRLRGMILPFGRVAQDRREIFTPDSVRFPKGGIRLLLEHRGREVMRFEPTIDSRGIHVDALLPDSPEGREAAEAVRDGKSKGLSIEFRAASSRLVQGVREVTDALVEAAALVAEGAYQQAVPEVRSKRRKFWL